MARFTGMLSVLAVSLALFGGCGGSGGGGVRVEGTVTYDGKPLPTGVITFMPVDDANLNTSSGDIVNGHYSLSTNSPGDGASPGQYRVAISSWEVEPSMDSPEGKSAIPMKYHDAIKSELSATVEDKSNTIDFDLKP